MVVSYRRVLMLPYVVRLRLLGGCAWVLVSLLSLFAFAAVFGGSIWSAVYVWDMVESPLLSLLVSSVVFVCVLSMLCLVAAAAGLLVDSWASPRMAKLRYSSMVVSRLARTLPPDPVSVLSFLTTVPVSPLHRAVSDAANAVHTDDLSTSSQRDRVALGERSLDLLESAVERLVSDAKVPSHALDLLASCRNLYSPLPGPWEVRPSKDSSQRPPLTRPEASEVIFVLNGRHLVEQRPLVSLEPVELLLALSLRSARPFSKNGAFRCMLAPGWLHEMLVAESRWFPPTRLVSAPPVGDAYVCENISAVFDIFSGLWSPPGGFDRAFAASVRLASLPARRSIVGPVG